MTLPVRAFLGGVSFHGWMGWVPSVQNEAATFQRVGQSGSGSEATGTRARPVDCQAWFACSTEAEAEAKVAQIEALQWTTGQFTDPFGRVLAVVRIGTVSAMPRRANGVRITDDTDATHVVTALINVEQLPS
jgi:hypothetical protein